MRTDWKAFLEDFGAEIEGDEVQSFGNPDLERRVVMTGDVIADLSFLGMIEAFGEDAATFLQGQITQDVRLVDEAHSLLGAYCNAKGRAIATFRLFKRDGAFYLLLPRSVLLPALKRLRMYVLRARVTLEDASDAFIRIGLSGPKAEREIEEALGPPPEKVDEVRHYGTISALRIPGPHPRFILVGDDLEAMEKLWTALDVRCAPVGAGPWRLLDILSGLPHVYPETAEAFVPQMLNLDALGGISFKKGCYTGQEVVARTQYLGKLKRRMYLAHAEGDRPLRPGDPIFQGEEQVGTVVDAEPFPDGGYELLAVIQIEAAERGHLHALEPGGPPLLLRTLPYQPRLS